MPPGVTLREVRESDLPLFFEDQRDPEACRLAAFTPRDESAFYAHWARILSNPAGLARTVVYGETVVGYIVSFDTEGQRETGYWIGRRYWGCGYATTALTRFLTLEVTRPLHATVAVANLGSVRVLERCGFAEVGVEDGGETPMRLFRLD